MAGMGHAVMGTAVRSGENRAVEAAQAAMASPLLEAGAIDGARGILINITGSSALRLSEVNAASSLIQEAAHEDANIIFGAVLDEKMGDEVKITVIATGFRDQMPERRARMLTVEESPVVSVPVLSSENWLREPVPAAAARAAQPARAESPAATALASAPMAESAAMPVVSEPEPVSPPAPRFMSEDEDAETAQAAPAAAQATNQPHSTVERELAAFEELFADTKPVGPARPRFAELGEEPVYKPLPRDYASDMGNGVRPVAAHDRQAVGLFTEKPEDAERDLEVPTFMRRMQF
jgi:cell division protein FtsZ